MDYTHTISSNVIHDCMAEAREDFKGRKALEEQLFHDQLNRTDLTPSSYHQQVTTLNSEIRNISDSAVIAENSVRILLAKENMSIEDLQSADTSALLRQWVHCSDEKTSKQCQSDAKFRTLDGSCNNLVSPMQGASMQPFRRILPPVYDDGFSSPRTKSVVGSEQVLPPAREVSRQFTDSAAPVVTENKLSMLFLTWGQILDHDMTNTGSSKGK